MTDFKTIDLETRIAECVGLSSSITAACFKLDQIRPEVRLGVTSMTKGERSARLLGSGWGREPYGSWLDPLTGRIHVQSIAIRIQILRDIVNKEN